MAEDYEKLANEYKDNKDILIAEGEYLYTISYTYRYIYDKYLSFVINFVCS